MDIKIRTAVFSLISALVMTVSMPLVSEITYRGRGGTESNNYNYLYLPEKPETVTENKSADTVNDIGDINEQAASDDAEIINEEIKAVEEKQTASDMTVAVLDAKSGVVSEMPLDDYIISVVSAEMPYTFNTEALKAQAVAARSFCIYRMKNGSGHENADICTDHSHCAAFVSRESLVDKHGKATADKILQKVGDAVRSTTGEIITYNGEPALAVFHSRSWKYTESSKNIWGGRVPYLVSVETSESDSIQTVNISESELKKLFQSDQTVKMSSSSKAGVLTSEINDSGRQSYLYYSGNQIKAKSLRTLIGLRSCSFEFQKTADGYEFTVHGYGHGVGMSQYGANEMAKNGSTYDMILTHYYTGVAIQRLGEL